MLYVVTGYTPNTVNFPGFTPMAIAQRILKNSLAGRVQKRGKRD